MKKTNFKVIESPPGLKPERLCIAHIQYSSLSTLWVCLFSSYFSNLHIFKILFFFAFLKMFPITLRLHLVITQPFHGRFQRDLVLWKALDELYTAKCIVWPCATRICASHVEMVKPLFHLWIAPLNIIGSYTKWCEKPALCAFICFSTLRTNVKLGLQLLSKLKNCKHTQLCKVTLR